tara:strand:- start:1113 stop:1415 length:303 start_codon:yes stop_codon:yes gene_type:complete
MFKLRGKVESITKEDINTSKGDFKKMLFVIEESESGFDHKYQFEIFGEESIAVHEDKIKQDRYVIIDFYIKSREWKNKYYNTLMVKSVVLENQLDDVPFN